MGRMMVMGFPSCSRLMVSSVAGRSHFLTMEESSHSLHGFQREGSPSGQKLFFLESAGKVWSADGANVGTLSPENGPTPSPVALCSIIGLVD